MPDAVQRVDMTVEEFLVWNLTQDQRYELVDGVPVPFRAVSRAKDEHDAIVLNLIAELKQQLRDSGCRPKTTDTAVRTKIKRVRRPDVTIECSPVEPGSLEARNPVAVFGVLSPTTRRLDRDEKLQEHIRHPSLKMIVHIDPAIMDVMLYTRSISGAWEPQRLEHPKDEITMTEPPISISFEVAYDGVPLAMPRAEVEK